VELGAEQGKDLAPDQVLVFGIDVGHGWKGLSVAATIPEPVFRVKRPREGWLLSCQIR
jgi:hypothetical protein